MISLRLSIHSNHRGPGFWKLNTSPLSDIEYVNLVKATIQETADEYKSDTTVNPALLWEMIKLNVREKSIYYATSKKAETKKKEVELEKKIAMLQKQIDNSNNNNNNPEHVKDKMKALKDEWEQIIEHRTRGAIIRSKTRWYNEGEKNTKYFLTLEKRHFKQGTISQLKTNDNDFITTDKDILTECKSFYEQLYTSRKNERRSSVDFFPPDNETKLNEEEQMICEGLLTKQECAEVLKNMDPEKTPGTDGFPAEFYKVFWSDISTPLLSSLNFAFDNGGMSITQRRSIIKLIPKKDAELYFIKNWRPLSLLNTDYKIAAKAIANRIKSMLPNVINNDQTGFLKGRFIGENVRLIDSVIRYAAEKNIPGLLLFIDFEKAFDSLERPFISDSLRYFGFGPSLINWVKVLYCKSESCVLNNGWSSDFFDIQRGVRQGCPLSPYLFILSAEILAKAIRKNPNIRGISINNNDIKISQYGDDTTLILDGSREALISALRFLDEFSDLSGLKLNDTKTEALWIGSSIGNDNLPTPGYSLKWPKKKVKTLGVWLSIHYDEKLKNIKAILSCWKYRRLTLMGKITVLKSLVVSQLTYILSPLPSNEKIINEINDLFYRFLWNDKGDKIKRKVMINDYFRGGLKMIDLVSFNKSLKLTWIKKYLDSSNKGKWKIFLDLKLGKNAGELVFAGNLSVKDTRIKFKNSESFTKELLEIWAEVNFEHEINSKEQLFQQPLWFNSLISIGNQPIFLKDWAAQGITKVKHLVKVNSDVCLSLSDLQIKFNFRPCQLKYYGVIAAVKQLSKSSNVTNNSTNYHSFLTQFVQCKKASRLVYKTLVERKGQTPENSQEKWLLDFNNEPINWKPAYILPFQCTNSRKLIEFQFKLLHRQIPTNTFLTKIGLKDNEKCTFCLKVPEIIIHIFWSCDLVSSFWKRVTEWLQSINVISQTDNIDGMTALGLRPDQSKFPRTVNLCCLLTRYYIWICKSKESSPNMNNFLFFVKSQYKLDAKGKAEKKWEPLAAYIQSMN